MTAEKFSKKINIENKITLNPPTIILIEPQLGQNIGMCARAMLNCGLFDLRIVRPRDGWPNRNAVASSADATIVINNAKIFQSTAKAMADLNIIFGTSARIRYMTKRLIHPEEAAKESYEYAQNSQRVGIMFGCESKGLTNNDIALSDALLYIPLNPSFNSLNLAQAVFTIGYEWFKIANNKEQIEKKTGKLPKPACRRSLINLFEHLELELEKSGFLQIVEKKDTMKRNIRNMLLKAHFSEQEVKTLRGIIRSLTSHKNAHD